MKKIFLTIIILFFTCPALSPKGSIQTKNIAVIPFQNITGDKEKNWIGAGFSETLTTKIVKVKEITVIEREYLSKILEEIKFQYSGAVDEKTAVEIGKMYGADVLVFGSFQVMGDTLRVTARFVDVETRKVIDTAEVTGNISDIFKLQDEIAFNLLDSLKIVLGEKEKEEIKVNPTENLTAYEWYSKGNEVYNLKLYHKSIEYFTKAIQVNPKYAEAYLYRGDAYSNNGLYDEAIEDFTEVIKLNQILVDTFNSQSILTDDDIDRFYQLAIAYFSRGVTYVIKSLYDEAIEDFTKAVQINPELEDAYYNRGVAYGKKGLDDKAIEDYTKAILINPKYAEAYCNRGSAYARKGLYDEAIENYTKAIQINPRGAEVYYSRGLAYYRKGIDKLCISDWKKAADLGSETARQNLKKFFNIDY